MYWLTYGVYSEELNKAAALIKHNPICSVGVKVSGASSQCVFSVFCTADSASRRVKVKQDHVLETTAAGIQSTWLLFIWWYCRWISSPESGKTSRHPWAWEHDQRWGRCSLGRRSGCRCVWPPLSIQKFILNKMHLKKCWNQSSKKFISTGVFHVEVLHHPLNNVWTWNQKEKIIHFVSLFYFCKVIK